MVLTDLYIKLNSVLPKSRSNGPGIRYVIWVQGCNIRCMDCCNKHTWNQTEGYKINVLEVINNIKKTFRESADTEGVYNGVTITGGEPLDQYLPVYSLCKELFPWTSIFLSTGYTFDQIIEKRFIKILDYIDIVCTDPFISKDICSGGWKGSSNQDIICLTKRGSKLFDFPVITSEVFINTDGSSIETGFTQF